MTESKRHWVRPAVYHVSVCVSICPLSSAEAPSVEKRWENGEKRERESAEIKKSTLLFPFSPAPAHFISLPRWPTHGPFPNSQEPLRRRELSVCNNLRAGSQIAAPPPSHSLETPNKCMPVSLSFCPIKRLRRQAKRNKPAYRPRCLLFPSFGLNTTRLVRTIPWDQVQTSPFYQATS